MYDHMSHEQKELLVWKGIAASLLNKLGGVATIDANESIECPEIKIIEENGSRSFLLTMDERTKNE